MCIFTLQKIEGIQDGLEVYKLVRHNKCQFDDFEKTVIKGGGYKSELSALYRRMEEQAKEEPIPAGKARRIQGKIFKEHSVYEYKTPHLRLYVLLKEPNVIVLLGGYKKNQPKDIGKLESLLKEYTKETQP